MPEFTPDQKARVAAAFRAALSDSKSARRHPAEVTSDRLAAAAEKWHDHFTGEERDSIARIRRALERIAGSETA